MTSGDLLIYKLPNIIDPENDTVQIVPIFGLASEFSFLIDDNKIIFSPKINQNGTFPIYIILSDSNKNKVQYKTYINLIPFSFNKTLSIRGKNQNTIDEIDQLINN